MPCTRPSRSALLPYALKRTLRAANGLLSPMGQHATRGDCVPFAGHSGGGITPQVLLRDDVQPVEVHRFGVADDHGQRRRCRRIGLSRSVWSSLADAFRDEHHDQCVSFPR